MTTSWDGIYAAYMSGSEGQGFAMFVFKDGVITGSDPMGVAFNGHYSCNESSDLDGEVSVDIPPNGTVIQGLSTGPTGFQYVVPISFAAADLEKAYVTLETPLGGINLKLEKLRGF